MAKISVIVPVYNAEKYLGKCIDSILHQTFDDLEIILVDDASEDRSLDIMTAYQIKQPKMIKIIQSKKNGGVAKARNIGIDIATGKYISFIDSDDSITPNMYEDMLTACEETSSQLARTQRKIVYKNLDLSFLARRASHEIIGTINPREDEFYLRTDPPCVTNKLFRRDLIADNRFPEGIKWEDYPFAIPLMVKANQVVTIPGNNYLYNMHLNSTTCTDARKLNPNLLDIFICSDIIGEACLNSDTNANLRHQINYIQIQNCTTRLREILNANIPLQEKRELLTLVSNLITTKYGPWQGQKDNNAVHRLIFKTIEKLLLPSEDFPITEEELKPKIKQKISRNIKK